MTSSAPQTACTARQVLPRCSAQLVHTARPYLQRTPFFQERCHGSACCPLWAHWRPGMKSLVMASRSARGSRPRSACPGQRLCLVSITQRSSNTNTHGALARDGVSDEVPRSPSPDPSDPSSSDSSPSELDPPSDPPSSASPTTAAAAAAPTLSPTATPAAAAAACCRCAAVGPTRPHVLQSE